MQICKEYYKNPMYSYIVQRIGEMGIRDTYKPILVDIILRRAYEYGLSNQEVAEDVETLVRYVRKIEIADIGDLRGIYFPNTCSIKISKSIFSDSFVDYEAIYETITHEVYHALSRKNNRNR